MPRTILLSVLAAWAAIAAGLPAQNRYSIRKLRCPGLAHGVARSIADDGTIVGEMLDTAGRSHAVRWRQGVGAQGRDCGGRARCAGIGGLARSRRAGRHGPHPRHG